MRGLLWVWIVASLALASIGCGASSAEVKTAKTAEYKASADVVFELAQQVAAETYKIGDADPAKHVFVTVPQFYSREGSRQSAGAGDYVNVTPGSVLVSLHVEVVDVGLSRVSVVVTPQVLEMISGSPQPRELAADDPNMPSWVGGRVDALQVAIYERAKGYIEKP